MPQRGGRRPPASPSAREPTPASAAARSAFRTAVYSATLFVASPSASEPSRCTPPAKNAGLTGRQGSVHWESDSVKVDPLERGICEEGPVGIDGHAREAGIAGDIEVALGCRTVGGGKTQTGIGSDEAYSALFAIIPSTCTSFPLKIRNRAGLKAPSCSYRSKSSSGWGSRSGVSPVGRSRMLIRPSESGRHLKSIAPA